MGENGSGDTSIIITDSLLYAELEDNQMAAS